MKGCKLWFHLGIAVLIALSAGCANIKERKVSGSVTWNGEPIPEGRIVFLAADGSAGDQGAIANGKYEFNVKLGAKRVEIFATRPKGDKVEPSMGMVPRESYIPARYNAESSLTADVTAGGDNHFDFTLTDAP